MSAEPQYSPGVCNIGPAERQQRYRYAAASIVAAVVYAGTVVFADAPPVLLIGLAVPVALATEWLLQARRSFCATLALAGRYAFDGATGQVETPANRRVDQVTAVRFVAVGIVAGLFAAGLAYWLAVSV
ncbi:hypothetical protein [Halosegnis sp.]|uniref:hypothetical protein n=1 Tax=Halosegnis sp. TaxID=2864959 RepID=UPI0035D4F935